MLALEPWVMADPDELVVGMTPPVQDGGMVAGVRDPEVELGQEELAARLEEQVAETVGRINQGHIELVAIEAPRVQWRLGSPNSGCCRAFN